MTEYAVIAHHRPHPKGKKPSAFCDEGRHFVGFRGYDSLEDAQQAWAYFDGEYRRELETMADKEKDEGSGNQYQLKLTCNQLTEYSIVEREVTPWQEVA